MKIKLVLDNIRSCYNVGAILRSAEGFGVEQVILSGYTPRVHDKELLPHLREKLDREIHKTALGAEDMLDIYSCGDIISELKRLREEGWQVVGLENHVENVPLYNFGSETFNSKLSDKVVLILGEEVNGIGYSLYDIIDLFVQIPMVGRKESFNVSVAAGIALYALVQK
ncbi:TrmH family RNA methyltransferase [Candidatus Saccharibacteria bacterium]|nr:TrmH family RNA methyltransferase [Candidatus Saccharibacteria bacterium]